ncbi:MAG: beta-lactamase family protein [Treponema sp.]|nr:beta-lactamase family protein [Treponema sp.]
MDKTHLNYIQNVFDDAVAAKKVAGLNIAVVHNGAEQGYWQAGFADIKGEVPFKRDTICRLFSMSKPVTAVAAWILIEKGELDLADPVGKFIPEFYDLKVCTEGGRNGKPQKCNRVLTVQDLLNMTSGYTYGAWWDGAPLGEHLTSDLINELNQDVSGENKITTLEVAKRLAKIPLSFEPGTGYAYGLSADILGAVIEAASGMKFSEFLKKNIFDPLGMKDTAFYVPEEKQSRFAKSYIYKNGEAMEEFIYPNLGIQPFMKFQPAFESGGAGLCSTLDDYLKFATMLVNGGELDGKRILQQKTVEYFSEARLSESLQKSFDAGMEHLSGYTYCNLLRVAYEKGRCKMVTENGEFGWDGWLGPYVSVDLKNKLVVVMLMQRTDAGTWEVTRKVKNIIYTSL